MADFVKGPVGGYGPFGRNEFLRSTQDVKTESYTLSKDSVPEDANGQKILQPGTVLAKITSGPEAGKVGPYQAAGTNEVQTATKTGTWSGGTYDITVLGVTAEGVAYDASAAAVKAALVAEGLDTDDVTITGGPLSTTALVFTFVGTNAGGEDQDPVVIDVTNVTGSTPGVGVVETTAGVGGATDGRQTSSNIVGLCLTFVPWTLLERDTEVSAVYECTAVQAWCFEYDGDGSPIALTNTTADTMRGTKGLDIMFK